MFNDYISASREADRRNCAAHCGCRTWHVVRVGKGYAVRG